MSRHLRIVLPLTHNPGIKAYCRQIFCPHLPWVRLSASFLAQAQTSTVSDYDQVLNGPHILHAVQAAQRDGCDGVFLDVAFDTALTAARAAVDIPVVGALQAAVGMAMNVAARFSILAINAEEVAVNLRLAREYGFGDRLVSVEVIDIPVMALRDDPEHTLQALHQATGRAVDRGARAVILGCTAMSWAAAGLQARVAATVLDTNLVGLYSLDAMVALGVGPSRLEFPRPSGLRALPDDVYAAYRGLTFDIRG